MIIEKLEDPAILLAGLVRSNISNELAYIQSRDDLDIRGHFSFEILTTLIKFEDQYGHVDDQCFAMAIQKARIHFGSISPDESIDVSGMRELADLLKSSMILILEMAIKDGLIELDRIPILLRGIESFQDLEERASSSCILSGLHKLCKRYINFEGEGKYLDMAILGTKFHFSSTPYTK